MLRVDEHLAKVNIAPHLTVNGPQYEFECIYRCQWKL